MRNKPYVKIYKEGILINPITKENPYLSTPHNYLKPSQRMWQNIINRFFTGKTIVK